MRTLAAALPVLAMLAASAAAQPPPRTASSDPDSLALRDETQWFLLAPDVDHVDLAHAYVQTAGFAATVDGLTWTPAEDYRVDRMRGVWYPLRPLGDGTRPVAVRLSYRYQPVPVPSRGELHEVRGRPAVDDSLEAAFGPGTEGNGEPAAESAPSADLVVRGSKTVRMASGSRRDMTVEQNLRLDIDGPLTETIGVHASLSDDNLPVVPEGNTTVLRDVDRVRVELTAPRWDAVLGDFVAERRGTVFGDYRRKLQGITLDARPEVGDVAVLAGSPRGLYRTLQIRGQESNQGPYYLSTGESGTEVFVVAGSERVRLDGEPMVRGADRDYVIDYVRGTITFTYRRMITSDSEIYVEYEAGEGPYARTVTGAEAKAGADVAWLGESRADLHVRLVREKDDPARLRTGELSEADRTVLADAGDDAAAAVASGWTVTAVGAGRYREEDVGGMTVAVYDTIAGDRLVEFYYAGPSRGDYAIDHLTDAGERVFVYRGAGGGSYLIGRPLPMPGLHRLATIQASVARGDSAALDLEWDTSRNDPNILSSLGDGDDVGDAWHAELDLGRGEWAGVGRFALKGFHDDLGSRFSPFQTARDLFRYDRWGLGERARRAGFLTQRDAESGARAVMSTGANRRRLGLDVSWGRLAHGPTLTADRLAAAAVWRWGRLDGASRWADASAADGADPLDVRRRERRQAVGLDLPGVRPGFVYEHSEDADAAAPDTRAGGYRRRVWTGTLGSPGGASWDWQAAFERGLADSLRAGHWRRERDSRTVRWRVGTPPFAGMRLTADGSVRRVLSPTLPEQSTRLGKVDLHGRWDRLGSDWGVTYSVDNSRTQVLDRQIVYVGERQGDYDQNGDYVGRDLGDFDVVTAATDSLVATTEVRSDLSWRQDFGLLGRDRLWGAWQSFTRATVRARSRTGDVGGLMRLLPSRIFDREDTVLGEVTLREEATFLRSLRRWDLRLVAEFDQGLDRQYVDHPEQRLRRRHQGTLSFNPDDRTTLQLRFQRDAELRSTRETIFSGNRSVDTVVPGWEFGWTRRPSPGNQITVSVERTTRRDAVSGVRQREWGLHPLGRLRLQRRWSGQADVKWSRVTSDGPEGAVKPYYFPYVGTNVEASTRLAWNPTKTLTVSLTWFGRRLGERGWQHDVRMESTARF